MFTLKPHSIFLLSYLLFLQEFCFCEELLELSCLNVTYCKQYQHDDVLVNCLEGRCQCNNNKGEFIDCKPREYKQNNIIGGACPCNLPSAECNAEEDVCYCEPHYVASADRRRCLQKTVVLGSVCEIDTQCMNADIYAVCNATVKRCECAIGFAKHDEVCKATVSRNVDSVGLIANCHNNSDCQQFEQLAFCSDKICFCPVGFVSAPYHTNCLAIANFQQSCIETTQCLRNLGPGAKCHNGVCHCADGYVTLERQSSDGNITSICQRTVELGNYCRTDMECHQQHLTHQEQTMHCFYGECNCKLGYQSTDNIHCSSSYAMSTYGFCSLVSIGLGALVFLLLA